MTVNELLTLLRETVLDDPLHGGSDQSCLWKDADLLAALDWAQREAAVRAKLIQDSTTVDLAVLTVTAGTGWIPLDKRITEVLGGYWDDKPLFVTDKGQLTRCYGLTWESRTGIPEAYLVDNDRVRLFRTPAADGVLTLDCLRVPLTAPVAGGTLELDATHHRDLLFGAAHRAYLKQDTQTLDKQAATSFGNLFEQAFGPPLSAKLVRHRRNMTSRTQSLPRF